MKLESARPVRVIHPPSFSLRAIVAGVAALTQCVDLLYALTVFRLTIRYRQSALGWIWAILQPLALIAIYTLVFSRLAKLPSEGVPYPVFVLTALLPWLFFSTAVSNSSNGVVAYPALLTKMYFPREVIVLSYVAAAFVDFVVGFLLLTGFMLYYGIAFSWSALLAVPVMLGLLAFTTAIALLLTIVQVRFRDVGVGLPLLLQVWLLATPVVYPLRSVPARFQDALLLNPMVGFIENFRRAALHSEPLDSRLLLGSVAVSVFCLVLAYGYFKWAEATMADFV